MIFVIAFLSGIASGGYLYPEQVHIAWTENENEMRVNWVTFWPVYSRIEYRPILCPDIPAPTQWLFVDGTSYEWDAGTDTVHIEYLHTGVIPGLRKECYYEYRVGNGIFWSDVFLFSGRTPDYSAPYDTSPVELIVLGDWGTGPLGQYTKHLLGQESKVRDFAAVLHVGDFGYDMDDDNGKVGDTYLNMVQEVSANFPYMTLPGNHEKHANFTQYKHKFQMPWNDAANGTSYFYSFNIGPAHIVMINTEVYFYYSNITQVTQMNWLLDDLKKANQNRDTHPWLIVLSHHPLYCSVNWRLSLLRNNGDCGVASLTMQSALEEVFYQNGVDIYFQAHVHNYERESPIYQNQTVQSDYDGPNLHVGPKAPIYITNGNAGNNHGHNDPTSPTPQDWARFWTNDYGYGRMIVYNNTHLYYEQFSAVELDHIDHVWVVKTQNRYN